METKLSAESGFKIYGKTCTHQKEDLVLRYAPLIKYLVNRIALRLPHQVDSEDLVSSGTVGMIEALERYDPTKGASFKTYAEFRIKGAIMDELRSLDWLPRSLRQKVNRLESTCGELERRLGRTASDEEVAEALNIGLNEFYEILRRARTFSLVSMCDLEEKDDGEMNSHECIASWEGDPAQALESQEIYRTLEKAIGSLPAKERTVISLYYINDLTLKAIAQVLNLTESRISQIRTQALLRLKKRLGAIIEQ